MFSRYTNIFLCVLVVGTITSNVISTHQLTKREVQVSGQLGPISGSISAGGSGSGGSSSSNGGSSSSSSSSSSSTSSTTSSSSSSASMSASGGSSSGSSGGASVQASGSVSAGTGSGLSGSASAGASVSMSATSTPKPEGGLLSKMKEMVKGTVETLTKDDKKVSVNASIGASSSGKSESPSGSPGGSSKGGLSAGIEASGSASTASGSLSAGASVEGSIGGGGGGGHKSEGGLMDKLGDMAKRGKEAVKDTANAVKQSLSSTENSHSGVKVEGSVGASVSGSMGGVSGSSGIQVSKDTKIDNPLEKVAKVVNKGTEAVRDTVQKIEDKASEVTEKVVKTFEDTVRKPMAHVDGSGKEQTEGRMMMSAAINAQMKASDRDKYLYEVKKKQEFELGRRPSNLKEIISDAKQRGVIPKNEDRTSLRGNHADEKSVTVDVLDKMHEIAKIPVESALKPLDKALGYEKDPLIRAYDNTHELLRRPISALAKPVESVFYGAFKTFDESKAESDKYLQQMSEQDRREARLKEEKARREDRSVVGSIADKYVELFEKPYEIILKPVDKMLGLDKQGKKNPLIKMIDEIYSMSKKPVDAIAKPFESILKKMADGDQAYQVSVRFNPQVVNKGTDPKLITRLADGALNIADRVMTKPLEVFMQPMNHALGYDEPGKKNPILDAAHSLKNATKQGVELFTRPIDRIIKEIAEIGNTRDEADLEQRRQDASRLVRLLDKLHELAQSPFEIVLRPVSKVLGYGKNGKKEPLLRAWDVLHQVVRTPIQVIEKPIEEALLGAPPKRPMKAGAKVSVGGQLGPLKAGASVSVSGEQSRSPPEPKKNNFIVEGIRKMEKIAAKPLDVVTSPIRKVILGEDEEKTGGDLEKSNRAIQAQSGGKNGQAQNGPVGKRPDKIIKTLESMNNVVLRPIEALTQPIADALSGEAKGAKVTASVSAGVGAGQGPTGSAGGSGGVSVSGGASISKGSTTVSGGASVSGGSGGMGGGSGGASAGAGGSINIGPVKVGASAQLKKN